MRILSLVLLTACGGGPKSSSDTGDDTTPTTSAAGTTDTAEAWAIPLSRGEYAATTLGFEDDSCGELAEITGMYAADARVRWDGPSAFVLDYTEGGTETPCTVDASGGITCGGYDQEWAPGSTASLWVRSDTTVFEVHSDTSFEQVETLHFTCEGTGCDDAVYGWDGEIPCTLGLRALYERR